MSTQKPKKVKLRVFTLPNRHLNKSKIEIVKDFKGRLKEEMKIANDRRMALSHLEDNKEEDLLSFYSPNTPDYIFGLILRIYPSDITSNIPDDFLNHEQINMSELKPEEGTAKIMFKDHYYFYLTDTFLITNLKFPTKIKRFQTYINWLLGITEPDNMYEFNTKIKTLQTHKLKDIKNIVFRDSVIYQSHTIKNISGRLFKNAFGDTPEFQKLIDKNILSAKLFVNFEKPGDLKREDYERFMGAQLNIIEDSNDINVVTKSGKVVKGSEFEYIKEVEIDVTSDGKLNEHDLLVEMKILHSELTNESNN